MPPRRDTCTENENFFDRPGISISGAGSNAEQFAMSDFWLYEYAMGNTQVEDLNG
jgi:hypothetical protein